MSTNKIIALALLVVGVGLAYWGYQMSQSVSSQLTKSLTGSFSDKVMWHYVGSVVCIVAGAILFKKK